MAKRIKFTATFADGTTLTRTSDRKEYTHAWRVIGERGPIPASWNQESRDNCAKNTPEGEVCSEDGFATREDLAHKAANTALNAYSNPSRGKYAMAYARSLGSTEVRRMKNVRVEVVAVTREG